MLLDPKLLDIWWDDIVPYLSELKPHHDLTPELIKHFCLTQNWLIFKFDDAIAIGHIEIRDHKGFYIAWVQGRGIIRHMSTFLGLLREMGALIVRGHNIESIGKLHARNTRSIVGRKPITLSSYIFDLNSKEYRSADILVEQLPQHLYERWVPELEYAPQGNYIRNMVIAGKAFGFKIGNMYVIGHMKFTGRKSFEVMHVYGEIKRNAIDSFLYFVETNLFTRFLTISCRAEVARVLEVYLKHTECRKNYETILFI